MLPEAVRVLITVAYLRQIRSQNVLSELLEINPNSIGQAIADSRQLLREHGHTIAPTTMRFSTASALWSSSSPAPCPRPTPGARDVG